jgi:hypothetical protein
VLCTTEENEKLNMKNFRIGSVCKEITKEIIIIITSEGCESISQAQPLIPI